MLEAKIALAEAKALRADSGAAEARRRRRTCEGRTCYGAGKANRRAEKLAGLREPIAPDAEPRREAACRKAHGGDSTHEDFKKSRFSTAESRPDNVKRQLGMRR